MAHIASSLSSLPQSTNKQSCFSHASCPPPPPQCSNALQRGLFDESGSMYFYTFCQQQTAGGGGRRPHQQLASSAPQSLVYRQSGSECEPKLILLAESWGFRWSSSSSSSLSQLLQTQWQHSLGIIFIFLASRRFFAATRISPINIIIKLISTCNVITHESTCVPLFAQIVGINSLKMNQTNKSPFWPTGWWVPLCLAALMLSLGSVCPIGCCLFYALPNDSVEVEAVKKKGRPRAYQSAKKRRTQVAGGASSRYRQKKILVYLHTLDLGGWWQSRAEEAAVMQTAERDHGNYHPVWN